MKKISKVSDPPIKNIHVSNYVGFSTEYSREKSENGLKKKPLLTALAESFSKRIDKVHQIIFLNVYFNIKFHFFRISYFP